MVPTIKEIGTEGCFKPARDISVSVNNTMYTSGSLYHLISPISEGGKDLLGQLVMHILYQPILSHAPKKADLAWLSSKVILLPCT